jgi:hypothetical protein
LVISDVVSLAAPYVRFLVRMFPPKVFLIGIQLVAIQAAAQTLRSTAYNGSSTAFIRYPHRPEYDSSTAMTIEAWVYRNDATRCETIVSHNYRTSYWFGFCPGLRFYRSDGKSVDATTIVPSRKWTHVAVSYDGTAARFYIDGQAAGVTALTHSGQGVVQPLMLGRDPKGQPFSGYLDEVRIWSQARTQTQIQENRFHEVRATGGLQAGISGWWRGRVDNRCCGDRR